MKYSFRHNISFKIIAFAIIISFLAYDIVWAYPHDNNHNLSVTGLQKKEVRARLRAGLIVSLIEKQSALRDHLAELTLPDILKWQESTEAQFDDVKFESTKQGGETGEVLISLSGEDIIIRYYDDNIANARQIPPGYTDITDSLLPSDIIHSKSHIHRQILAKKRKRAGPPANLHSASEQLMPPISPAPDIGHRKFAFRNILQTICLLIMAPAAFAVNSHIGNVEENMLHVDTASNTSLPVDVGLVRPTALSDRQAGTAQSASSAKIVYRNNIKLLKDMAVELKDENHPNADTIIEMVNKFEKDIEAGKEWVAIPADEGTVGAVLPEFDSNGKMTDVHFRINVGFTAGFLARLDGFKAARNDPANRAIFATLDRLDKLYRAFLKSIMVKEAVHYSDFRNNPSSCEKIEASRRKFLETNKRILEGEVLSEEDQKAFKGLVRQLASQQVFEEEKGFVEFFKYLRANGFGIDVLNQITHSVEPNIKLKGDVSKDRVRGELENLIGRLGYVMSDDGSRLSTRALRVDIARMLLGPGPIEEDKRSDDYSIAVMAWVVQFEIEDGNADNRSSPLNFISIPGFSRNKYPEERFLGFLNDSSYADTKDPSLTDKARPFIIFGALALTGAAGLYLGLKYHRDRRKLGMVRRDNSKIVKESGKPDAFDYKEKHSKGRKGSASKRMNDRRSPFGTADLDFMTLARLNAEGRVEWHPKLVSGEIELSDELKDWLMRHENWHLKLRSKKLPHAVEEIAAIALAFEGMTEVTDGHLQALLAAINTGKPNAPPNDISDKEFLAGIANYIIETDISLREVIASEPGIADMAHELIRGELITMVKESGRQEKRRPPEMIQLDLFEGIDGRAFEEKEPETKPAKPSAEMVKEKQKEILRLQKDSVKKVRQAATQIERSFANSHVLTESASLVRGEISKYGYVSSPVIRRFIGAISRIQSSWNLSSTREKILEKQRNRARDAIGDTEKAYALLDEIDSIGRASHEMPERVKAAEWREYIVLNATEIAFRIEFTIKNMDERMVNLHDRLEGFVRELRNWLNDDNKFDNIEERRRSLSAMAMALESISQKQGVGSVTRSNLAVISERLNLIVKAMERDRGIPDGSPYAMYILLDAESRGGYKPIDPGDLASKTVGRSGNMATHQGETHLSVEHTIVRDLNVLVSIDLAVAPGDGKKYATFPLNEIEKEAVKLVLKRLGARPAAEQIEKARAEIFRIKSEKADYNNITHFDAGRAVISHREFMGMKRVLLITHTGHSDIGDELIKSSWLPEVLCRENPELRVELLAKNTELFENNPYPHQVSAAEVFRNTSRVYDAVFVLGWPGDEELDNKLKEISGKVLYNAFHHIKSIETDDNGRTEENIESDPALEQCKNKYAYIRLLLSRFIGGIKLDRPTSLHVSEDEMASAESIVKYSVEASGYAYDANRRRIIINPFSRELQKTFDKQFIINLVLRLRNEFPEAELLLVPGMTHESEEVLSEVTDAVRGIFGNEKRLPIQVRRPDGKLLALRELIGVINLLHPARDVLIGADTATLHIASALEKHSITYYLNPYLTPEIWSPNNDYSDSIKGYNLTPEQGIELIISKARKIFDQSPEEEALPESPEEDSTEGQFAKLSNGESPILLSMKLLLSQVHKQGAGLSGSLLRPVPEGPDIKTGVLPRAIPINVDIFSEALSGGDGADIAERFLEILALKQLYINRNGRAVEFVFITRSGDEKLLGTVRDIYSRLYIVRHYLRGSRQSELKNGFTITELSDDASLYNERCLFLGGKVKAEEGEDGIYMWSGILDLAVSLTMLMDCQESVRAQYYPEITKLYQLLLQDRSRTVDDSILKALLDADVNEARAIAKRLAISPIGKFNINERRTLYILMRTLWEAA